jgi:hypothetical protein
MQVNIYTLNDTGIFSSSPTELSKRIKQHVLLNQHLKRLNYTIVGVYSKILVPLSKARF